MALSEISAPFELSPERWGPVLRAPALSAVADHFFTLRQLQLREADARVHDWARVAEAIGVGTARLLRPRQVHGCEVVVVNESGLRRFSDGMRPEADVLVSGDPSVALAVQVADCVPILMADRRTGAVAAAHAGWRGTAAGVVRAAVGSLIRQLGSRAGDLVTAVGPSIGPCCYTVGPEVVDRFVTAGHQPSAIEAWFVRQPTGGYLLDLWRATIDQLMESGVRAEHIHAARLCTAHETERFFSYRAEGSGTGRMAAVIRARG